jgi:hypothetical protein
MTQSTTRAHRPAARMTAMACLIAATGILSTAGDAAAQHLADESLAARSLPVMDVQLTQPPGDPGAPSAGVIAGQVALGTLATPVGYVGGGLATRWVASRLGASEEAARRVAYVGAYSGAAIATAATVEFLGRTSRVSGSFPVTLGGAVAGELASWGVVELGRALFSDSAECNLFCNVLGASAFVLPSIGATVGHAISREWR